MSTTGLTGRCQPVNRTGPTLVTQYQQTEHSADDDLQTVTNLKLFDVSCLSRSLQQGLKHYRQLAWCTLSKAVGVKKQSGGIR